MTGQPRLKDLGRWLSGGTPPKGDAAAWDGDIPWISAKDIDSTRLRPATTFVTRKAASEHSTFAPPGAIVVIVRGMALAHGLPVVLTHEEVAFNQDLRVLIPHPGIEPRFLYYSFIGHRRRFGAHIDRAAHGTARVNESVYGERIWLPPRSQQLRIADFLDEECHRIDMLSLRTVAFDEAKVEQYERLLRDLVGVERHPTVQIRYVAKTGTGHTPSRSHPEWWTPERCIIPWFTLGDVWQIRDDEREVVTETSERVSPEGLKNSSAVLHQAGTVLLSRTASVGFSGVMGVPMAVSQDFMTWTCGPRLIPEFLLYALRAMRPELRGLMYGSTHKTIYMPDLHSLRVPLPPVAEQRAAVAAIRSRLATHWTLRERNQALRARLAEYRDALIAESVAVPSDMTGPMRGDRESHALVPGASE